MNMVRLQLVGGPAHGREVLFLRPLEFKVGVGALGVRAAAGGDPSRYEWVERPGTVTLAYAGAATPEDVEAARQCGERWVEESKPDGVLRHKTRVFFEAGPADGHFLVLLYPPDLSLCGLGLEVAPDQGVAAGRRHSYRLVPSWQEPEGLASDALVYRHEEIAAAPAEALAPA